MKAAHKIDSKLSKSILAEVNEKEIVAMACDVVNIPSPTGEELEMGRYMRGDPHLVATERPNKLSLPAPVPADWQKGGEDTTFTDSTTFGYWVKWSGTIANTTAAQSGTR